MNAVEAAAATHAGRTRRTNEDSYLRTAGLWVVADGMGGAQAGEVASRLAIETFRDGLDRAPDVGARLRRTIERANGRIHAVALRDPSRAGMGTTVTAAVLENDRLHVGHVGDSRAYLLRNGALVRITQDHSLVEELVRAGALAPADAANHPQRSVITRALGTEADVVVDVYGIDIEAGDTLLLASDGLTTMVDDEQIARLVTADRPLADRAWTLIDAANEGGGEDNITVVLVRFGDGPSDSSGDERPIGQDIVLPAPPFLHADHEPAPRDHGTRRLLVATGLVLFLVAVVVGIGHRAAVVALRRSHRRRADRRLPGSPGRSDGQPTAVSPGPRHRRRDRQPLEGGACRAVRPRADAGVGGA